MKFFRLLFLYSIFPLALFAQPTLQQKIAQMLMVGFSGQTVPESLKVDLQARGLGGVILFAPNILNPAQVQTLTTELQSLSAGTLFIAVDQEGGKVARLNKNNGFASTPTAYQLGTVYNSEDSTRTIARLMASWLSESGCNVDFAPVADVNVNPLSPAIGAKERSYSSDPEMVVNHIGWFVDEFHKKNILTTLKHFPGHGSAASDSHLGFTDITTTWADSELIPFKSAIDRGKADLIMVGHLYNAVLDSLYPASLSHNVVTHLLRDSLGFHGVVISDELFMGAIELNFEFDNALTLCVNSGTDILLFSTNTYNNSSLTAHVVNLISSKVDSGIIAESTIDSAYNRIQRLKSAIPTTVEYASNKMPGTSELYFNYPNPFNSTTIIRYRLHTAGNVRLKIFDLLGRDVASLVNTVQSAGEYSVSFTVAEKQLTSGMYFYRLETGGYVETKKMLYIK
jgi:beta-N-acetylhexosaminidase